MNTSELFSDVVLDFLEDREFRSASPTTLTFYRERLTYFARDTSTTSMGDVTEKTVRRWLLSKRHLSPATVANYARALRTFCNWCVRRGHLTSSPFVDLPVATPKQSLLVRLTHGEVTEILRCAAKRTNPTRDTAIIRVLYDTGIRVGELVSLELRSINWRDGLLLVTGKTGPREVPFGTRTKRALTQYLDKERTCQNIYQPAQLFLTRGGEPMTAQRVTQHIRRLCAAAHVQASKTGPHVFRHSFSVEYLMNGGDIFSLQRILGHSSLEQTQVYARYLTSDLSVKHRKFSPGDRLSTR